MSRRSCRRGTTPAFPALAEGVQNGLRRLVSDNAETVATMLEVDKNSAHDVVCEKCAHVMRQQQLSIASFLARFFSADILSEQAALCGKSGKGSAAALADRIAAAWANNNRLMADGKEVEEVANEDEKTTKQEGAVKLESEPNEDMDQKRKTESEATLEETMPKKSRRVNPPTV